MKTKGQSNGAKVLAIQLLIELIYISTNIFYFYPITKNEG